MQRIARTWGAGCCGAAKANPKSTVRSDCATRETREREGTRGNGHGASKRAGWSACLGCAECGAIPCPDDYSDRMVRLF